MHASKEVIVLVIECQSSLDWRAVFAGSCLESGELVRKTKKKKVRFCFAYFVQIRLEQATWDDISLVSWPEPTGLRATLRSGKSFRPDHVLVRSVSKGTWTQDSSNKLMALCHSAVPCTNSASACHAFLEKPVVYGELRRVQQRLGKETFPLIDQVMYPSYKEMSVSPGNISLDCFRPTYLVKDVPCVGKTGSAHAGKGKIKITSSELWEDYASLVALQPYFCTAEKFINWLETLPCLVVLL
jgi:hypothetical protein